MLKTLAENSPRSAAACAILCFSLLAPNAARASTELARVGDHVITLEDFNHIYKDNLKFFQFQKPSKAAVLDDLIKRNLGVQEAKKEGLDRDPEIMERMETVLYQALLERKLAKDIQGIHVETADAESFYKKNPEIRTSHIFIAVAPDAKDKAVQDARTKIEECQKMLREGKSFAETAQKCSEGVAAPNGGDIDFQTRDRLDPKYFSTALSLKTPGKVSDIIRTPFGFHIIKLTAIRGWNEVDQASVKRAVFEQRRAQLYETYMKQLRQQYKVVERADLIKE